MYRSPRQAQQGPDTAAQIRSSTTT